MLSGKITETRALLDSGSNRSFCGKSLAYRISSKGKPAKLVIDTLMGKRIEQRATEVELMVWSTQRNGYQGRVYLQEVIVIDQLPQDLKYSGASKEIFEKWGHLMDSESPERTTEEVELLIGQDAPLALFPLEARRSSDGKTYAVKTRLGWAVCGAGGYGQKGDARGLIITACTGGDQQLNLQVQRFWEIDSSPHQDTTDGRTSVEDNTVLKLWNEYGYLEQEHYHLNIPFRAEEPKLPNNINLALQRLKGLKRRLLRDSELMESYGKEMRNLLDKGYAEVVPTHERDRDDGRVWYLPHHPVLNPNKPDKVRIVFDCAAVYKHKSLNQEVMQGPDFMNKLLGVLFRFRQEPVAIMADINSMFHQIAVPKEDRDVLRFLWWENGDLNSRLQTLRMKVHLFGGIWSPSCAQYALQRTFRDHGSTYSETIVQAERNFYVDDLLMSVSNPAEACWVSEELRNLLSKGGFHLSKWISNNRQVMCSIPANERHKSVAEVDLGKDMLPAERALGIAWDLELDRLATKTCVPLKPWTKRGILSVISSVYDPLGFLCPFTIKAKIIFQEECRRKGGWDEPIAEENFEPWRRWLEELPRAKELQIPRCYVKGGMGRMKVTQLHHFCDASRSAYSVVSYLRTVNEFGETSCAFVFGRARLAPLKQQTIPRLELCAAVMAARMNSLLVKELDIHISKIIFWTDSEIVLRYIYNAERRFQTFVANRVANIRELTSVNQWKYISSKSNPADEATRGMSVHETLNIGRWLYGPKFLLKGENDWPTQQRVGPISEMDPEIRKSKAIMNLNSSVQEVSLTGLWERYSSWHSLLRGVAWLRRYLKYIKHGRTWQDAGDLTVGELKSAKLSVLLAVQTEAFNDDKRLMMKKTLTKRSPLYRLEPYLDETGLIRVGGRTRDNGGQVLLPRNHPVSILIVREIHQLKVGHSGREQVLATLREEFWISGCRRMIDRELRQCVICRRNNWRSKQQRQADLPLDRISPGNRPFTSTGIDCFGPILVKIGRKTIKRWGCLFSCMASRAIHLEVLSSLNTDALIMAISRFISRRGRPDRIRSDNGTNMVGAAKELKEAVRSWNNDVKFQKSLVQREIEWLFNPPTASHMSGAWERQIRTVRKILRAIIGSQVLDDYRLQTLFCEIEDIVNRRPITPVSTDIADQEAITPSHLLLRWGGPNPLPLAGVLDQKEYRKQWKHVQWLADNFWKRWLKEYIPQLQRRSGTLTTLRNLRTGDMVLVTDKVLPRNQWKLGRVVEVMSSGDNVVRQVKVRTSGGTLIRPINKLCLLELPD